MRAHSNTLPRALTTLVAAALTLAACGGGASSQRSDGGAGASPSATSETAATVSTTAAATDEAGRDPATATPDGSARSSAENTRTVSHAMGTTEVPADPQRVVVLDTPHLDAVLSLGVTPVASVTSSVSDGLPDYLGERTEGVEIVGTIQEPNLEKITSLNPDLILSAVVRHEDVYGKLSDIAPTVFTKSSGTNFKKGLRTIADALGRNDELATELESYDARAAEVGKAVDAAGKQATIVRFLPSETRLYGPDTFSGTVLTDIGFRLGDKGFEDPYSMAKISPEQAGKLQGDVVFRTTYGDQEKTAFGEMQPLLEQLDAPVYAVGDREWMLGIGLIGAKAIFSDVERLMR